MRKIHLKSCQKVILMAVVMLCSLSSLYAQVGQDSDRCCKGH